MDIRKHINTERRDFELSKLDEIEINKDPIQFFEEWLSSAIQNKVSEPNAFCLSTAF